MSNSMDGIDKHRDIAFKEKRELGPSGCNLAFVQDDLDLYTSLITPAFKYLTN